MAKVKNPLFSLTAHGSVARRFTMQRQQGRQHCKTWAKPSGQPSAAQQLRRATFKQAAATWAALTPAERAPYQEQAKAENITAWNAYARACLLALPQGNITTWDHPRTVWDNDATAWLDQ